MKRNNNKGFTLIELLIVIAVIGILAAIIFGQLGSSRIKAKDAAIVLETKQLLTQVELETKGAGNYTGVCDLFDEDGNQLKRIKTDIEDNGGIWEGCVDGPDSYAVTITLNSAQANNIFANTAYAQVQAFNNLNLNNNPSVGYNGVHSNQELLLSETYIKALRQIAEENNDNFIEPSYYCTGAVPPHIEGGNFLGGFLYQLPESGCGSQVSSSEVAAEVYADASGNDYGVSLGTHPIDPLRPTDTDTNSISEQSHTL